MTEQAIARALKRFKQAVEHHDRRNPTHPPAYAITSNPNDVARLGFEDGEELWRGVTLRAGSRMSVGRFRVECGYEDEPVEREAAREDLRAVGLEAA